MRIHPFSPLLLAAALALGLGAPAPARAIDGINPVLQQDLINDPGFLRFHPDLKYQLDGVRAWEEGNLREAYDDFLRASRYGNKLAQAMVAEMLWTGQGVVQDRALAYAWMDLAGERRYKSLLVMRERYWNELDAAERERALAVGKDVYAEYGDEVAKPRLERQLRRGRSQSTGSRLGANRSSVRVYTNPEQAAIYAFKPLSGGMDAARQPNYYADRYWEPEHYWYWQNAVLDKLPAGAVSVLPPRAVD